MSPNNLQARLSQPPAASIFRNGDIRGVIDATDDDGRVEIDEYTIHSIATRYGDVLASMGITEAVVGYDSRSYSFGLHNAAVLGLLAAGLDVVDVGLATTPMVQWQQHRQGAAGGLMVTASHNPNGWAGLKLTPTPTTTLAADDFATLQQGLPEVRTAAHPSTYRALDVGEEYVADLGDRVDRTAPLRVVVDGGNAVGGPLLARALTLAGHDVVSINHALDWTFPNHEPDPDKLESRQQASAAVLDHGADLGLLIDGDGDRLGVVDGRGRDVGPDSVFALFAADVCRRVPGAVIVYDVKSSMAIDDLVRQRGGRAVMAPTGHMNIKRSMRDVGAVLGGERSGHYFDVHRHIGTDDAIFAALRLLEIVGASGRPVAELVAELPSYPMTPTMHTECPAQRSAETVEAFLEHCRGLEPLAIETMDGARVRFTDGWILVRASNNMPQLVIVAEASDEAALGRLYAVVREALDPLDHVSTRWSNDPWGGQVGTS